MTLGYRVCVLRDGRLQQVDTPQALFARPVNLFVAGFIGSPAMNFATAALARDGGLVVTFAEHTLPLPPSFLEDRPGLAGYLGREIIVGVRPSDFEDATIADPAWPKIAIAADVTEELGRDPRPVHHRRPAR